MKDPQHALDRDVRRLMRSLSDARALRSNPLLRPLGIADDDLHLVEAVQRFVRGVLPKTSRMAEIFERCDVERETHKAVSMHMGLSIRQFYRERSQARTLVREAIAAELSAAVVDDASDVLADELEGLHESVHDGRVEAALRGADQLLRCGLPDHVVRALIGLKACAFSVSGRREQAAGQLETARLMGPLHDELAAELEYAHAYALAAQGRHADAISHCERATRSHGAAAVLSARHRRAQARRLSLLGNLYQEDHDPRKAIATLESAGRLLQACRIRPQAQSVRIAVDLAASCLSIADKVDEATTRAVDAYRAATWHGLAAERVLAQIILDFAALASGERKSVLKGLPESEYCTFAGAEGHWLARLHLLVSRIQTARGKSNDALASVRAARTAIPDDHCLRALADLRAAEALNAARAPGAALPLALDALPRVALGGRSHYAGAAHVAAADALQQMGDARRAREHCEAGVERLRRGGLVPDLSRALRLAARLTGDARYAEEQRALVAG